MIYRFYWTVQANTATAVSTLKMHFYIKPMLTYCKHTLTCEFLYFIALSVADNKVAHHNEKSVHASCIEDDDEELQMSHSSTTAGKHLKGLYATTFSIHFHSCICLLKSVISVFTIKPRKDLQG